MATPLGGSKFPVPAAGKSRGPTPRLTASHPLKQQQQQQPRWQPDSVRGPTALPTTPRNTYRDALVTPRGSQGGGASLRTAAAAAAAAAEPVGASSSRSGVQALRGKRSPSPLGRQQQVGDAAMASSRQQADVGSLLQRPVSQNSLEPHQQVPAEQLQQQEEEYHSQPRPTTVTQSGVESSAEQTAVAGQPAEHHHSRHHQQEEEQQQQQQQQEQDPESDARLQQRQEAEQLQAALNSHQAELQQRLGALAELGQQRSALAAQVAAAQQLCMQARQREEARRAELQDLDLANMTLAATLENYKLQAGAAHNNQARLGLLQVMLAAARLAGAPGVAAAVEKEIASISAPAPDVRPQRNVGSGEASRALEQLPESRAEQVGGSGSTAAPPRVPELLLPQQRAQQHQPEHAPPADCGRCKAAVPVGGVCAHSSDGSSDGYDAVTPADSDTTSSSCYSSSSSEESCSTAESGPREAGDARHSDVGNLALADSASSHMPRLTPPHIVPALQLGEGLALGGAPLRIATLRQDTPAVAAAGSAALPSARGSLAPNATADTAAAATAALVAVSSAGAGKAGRPTVRAPARLLLPGSPCLMTAVEAVGTAAGGAVTPTGAGMGVVSGGGDGLRSPLSPLAMQRLQSIRRKFEAAECIMAAVVEQAVVL
ncbi:hypothetical protein N2152v2_002577 [Parachlorella kessleri]